ncbi:MAG: hypothetical protein WD382_02070 [Halofilum sp. (in: g-proteobacteria)]
MTPTSRQPHRRSFVAPRLVAQGARFVEIGDTAIAADFPETNEPALGLVDLSPLPRTGIKGPKALDHLRAQGWPVPEDNNLAVTTPDGELICRLSDHEVLVLASPQRWLETHTAPIDALAASVDETTAWAVPRRDSHCWFILRGPEAGDCLQKLCGVDLRPGSFAPGAIAQTSIARLNGIVCRSHAAADEFHILADSASAVWFWDALLDAAEEFGGGPSGLADAAFKPDASAPQE